MNLEKYLTPSLILVILNCRCLFFATLFNPGEAAKQKTGSMRHFTYGVIFQGMSETRPADERNNLVEEIYNRFTEIVSGCPANYEINMVEIVLEVVKVNRN